MSNRRRPASPTCVRGAGWSYPGAGSICWSCPRTNRTCAGTGTTDAGTRKGGAPDSRPDRRLAATGRNAADLDSDVEAAGRPDRRLTAMGRNAPYRGRAVACLPGTAAGVPPIHPSPADKCEQRATPDRTPSTKTLVNPIFPPRNPAKNAKNAAPSPRLAGPAPAATTCFPDAPGQCPAGPRSEDDPCPGLRRLPTGGAFGSSIDTASVRHRQYPCGRIRRVFLSFRGISPDGRGARPKTAARRLSEGRGRAPGSGIPPAPAQAARRCHSISTPCSAARTVTRSIRCIPRERAERTTRAAFSSEKFQRG